MKPGTYYHEHTYMTFDDFGFNSFRKGDIITPQGIWGLKCLVTKMYPNTKFRRFLNKLGFNLRINQIRATITRIEQL